MFAAPRLQPLCNAEKLMNDDFSAQARLSNEDSSFLAGTIPAPLPPQVLFHVGMTLEEVERQMLFKTLAYFDNHKPKAAEALGISLKTVYNRLARFGYAENDADVAAVDNRNPCAA
jgi:DNA-binding NtrC family response regulator